MTIYLSVFAGVLLYLGASALLLRNLKSRTVETVESSAPVSGLGKRPALLLAATALVLHVVVLLNLSGLPDALNLSFFTALSTTLLAIVLVHLLMCLTQPADYLGLVVYPLAAAGLVAGVLFTSADKSVSPSLQLHIVLSITANALLALGAMQAALVFVQRRYLKRHQPGGFMRALPPLTTTETMLFTLLKFGFALLTLSLLSGFVFLEDMFAQALVHKTVLSCLAWCIFAVLLFGRWRFGWRGQRAVSWTLIGFTILLIAYFGSKLVLELILKR